MTNDELAREIAEFATYELKNEIREISAMSVEDQDKVKETIRFAVRTTLEREPGKKHSDGST